MSGIVFSYAARARARTRGHKEGAGLAAGEGVSCREEADYLPGRHRAELELAWDETQQILGADPSGTSMGGVTSDETRHILGADPTGTSIAADRSSKSWEPTHLEPICFFGLDTSVFLVCIQ